MVGSPVDHSCGDHLGVMSHHPPGDDGPGGGLLAGGGDHLLAVLGVHGVHYLVVLLVTERPRSKENLVYWMRQDNLSYCIETGKENDVCRIFWIMSLCPI